MKSEKLGIVEELKEKYNKRLARVKTRWENEHDDGRPKKDADIFLFQKWAYRVGKGWYGFDLGHIPTVWTDMLDDFLSWLESQCPDFEIHQIKIKGFLRIYVGTKTDFVIPDENIRVEISKLQDLLRTPQSIRNIQAAQRADAASKKRQKPSRKP